MTDINKQKFLAELAQLLTFMYEEDRQTALQIYAEMFEAAEDERALIQALISPIRQAVLVARAYNATERRLSVHSQSREGEPDNEQPAFLNTLYQIRADALSTQPEKVVEDENQFSLFDQLGVSIAPSIVIPDHEFLEVPVTDAPAPVEPVIGEAPLQAADFAAGTTPEEIAAPADEVDAFLADFSLPAEVTDAETPSDGAEAPDETELDPVDDDEDEVFSDEHASFSDETVRKPRPLLLTAFIILAIPLTLLGILLLLIPTALSLGLAASFLSAGAVTFSAAFSGFAVLADLFVILGAALLMLAFGLLFLWLFVWFIGGAIVGLVRGVIELGGNWCFKEVPAL